ncbi:MAG: HD-GYP domain-containing protein [Gammaproteobacteria bacterium]|nr:HD-GYP domain-containing protein [Gammaproteobacteria bacterium]
MADLRVGMFVVELDIPWEQSTFMFQGLELKTTADILEVQKQCKFVFVDYNEFSLRKDNKQNGLPANPNLNADSLVSVQDEYSSAQQVNKLASATVTNLFQEIRLGAEIDGSKVKQAVSGCVDSIMRNQDASVWLTRIQAKDEGTAQHSLNVAALSIVMAKAMNLNTRELEDIGVCAMLHDVGKTSVPEQLLNKREPLTQDELEEMRKHTRYGRDILVSTKSVMSGAADVAHAHHERPDGKGYPRGLTDEKIPLYAKIVAIAEAYDVITTKQPYRDAKSPSEALQELYAQRGKQFDEDLVLSFIDAVGVFPPGSIVEFTQGDIGIVLSNTSDKLKPRIIMILDENQEPIEQHVIDLSVSDHDAKGKVYQIKTTLPDGSYGINVEDFQRAGLRLGA